MSEMPKQLVTIQREHNLNDVFALDEPGPGGACHKYAIARHGLLYVDAVDKCLSTEPHYEGPEPVMMTLYFQNGPRNDPASKPGLADEDLLEIVRDRLKGFQRGPFACEANDVALNHVVSALIVLNSRTQERANRGVLGKNEP